MIVRELMSAPVVTVAADETLRDAVGRFLAEDIGCVVVVERDGGTAEPAPTGILTATDILRATYERGEPLSAIPAGAAASSPLVTVAPGRTVGRAVERMTDEDVRHLPVVEGLDVVGIVTLTDVAAAYEDVREEAMELVGERAAWDPEE